MQAQWIDTTVGENGQLVLEGLPFEPGQSVEVLVVSKSTGPATVVDAGLQGSVLAFQDALEPVAAEEWDVLR